jgi:hypothetical protein
MCYEKNEKQMRKIGEFFFRKIGKKNETRKQKKTICKKYRKKVRETEKRTGNANPKKRAGKDVEDREENLGQDAPLPLHYICKMLLHVYHHVYLRK